MSKVKNLGASGRRKRAHRWQAMVEFALLTPVFVMLLFAIVEFSQAAYAYSFVSYAARDASRWASVRGKSSDFPASAGDIRNFVDSQTHGMSLQNLTITTSWAPDNKPGSVVKVQVRYNMPLSMPFIPTKSIPLTSTSQMVIAE